MSVFDISDRARQIRSDLLAFMDSHVYPAEAVYEAQMRESGNPNFHPPILEELKAEARSRGLWNLFHPHPDWGPGLTNSEYAPLCEIMGRSPHLAPEACNCNAPDTGNMEVFTLFGTDEHKEKYLKPLLDGRIRSAFAMTEPQVASSDATNVQLSMVRDGDHYILNGRKWFASNALHANCTVMIVMGKTDPNTATHRQQSMMVVPMDAPGVTVLRGLPVFGYQDREGHAEIDFKDVRVPVTDVLKGEGEGFAIAQARLGPGRIHPGVALPPGAIPGRLRQADRRQRQHPGLDRRGTHRHRDDPVAHPQGRLPDGHRRQQGGAGRDRRDQGRRSRHRAEDRRPGHPGARRRWCHRRLPAGGVLGAPAHAAPGRRTG
jgi:acyl-CoA dehydrogenase